MTSTTPEHAQKVRYAQLWEANYDWLTTKLIDDLPIMPSWRCLDAGAGAGSMSYWLAERVPQGAVIAMDTDISLLDADRAPNLTVQEADISTVELEPGSLDFILMRGLLSQPQVKDADDAIARAVRWLAPGGWLLAEDFCYLPHDDSPTANGQTVIAGYLQVLQTTGMNVRVGRRLPARLAQAGLTSVDMHIRALGPGQGGNALIAERMKILTPRLLSDRLLTQEEIDEFIATLDDPEARDIATLEISAWGQRP
ncbi:MAG TPA: class I SAM-dependent methyltransferase [Streptosporangiaceae bacterium]|nr:class I SAM-dependent methyltransferase [Streptosporangiaceae bacterium]